MRDRFTMVLFAVFGLTLLCGGLATFIAFKYPKPTPPLERLYNKLLEIATDGSGAIIGLLGGSALASP